MPKEKKNLLKNLKVSSVDLCSQGANQEAYICLKKSADGGKDNFFKKFFYAITKAVGMTEEQFTGLEEDETAVTKSETIKDAMTKSFESILADESLSEEERKEMIQKNVNDFYQDVEELTKSNMEKDGQYQKEESEEKELNIEKMSPEDKAVYEILMKKYTQMVEGEEINKSSEKKEKQPNVEIQKAIEELKATKTELEELKKSLEMKELETVAKKYEVLGKDTKELAGKLYTLKKSNENGYQEYLSMLDEFKEMQEQTGIFKEIGSDRKGSSGDQELNQRIQEIRKADTSISYEAAYVRACEETGKGMH